jgi:hypothetical protein
MTKPFSVIIKSAFGILFAFSAVPTFAQHGGGGHAGGGGFHGGSGGGGGGFHGGGGGGFHGGGGGGFHSGGGGPRGGGYAPPAAGYGASRAATPSPMRSGGGFVARPGNNDYRPGGNFSGGNQRYGSYSSPPPAVADGQWHSFFGPAGNRGPVGPQSQAGAAASAGGFHIYSGNRNAGSPGAVRSFSGQGREIWENSPVARNVIPKSQSLASIHNSFSSSLAARSGLQSNSTLSANSSFTRGPGLLGNRVFSSGVNAANSHRLGTPILSNPNRIRGCWSCGVGFGGWGGWGWRNPWGWGFGWGGWGWGGWGWPWVGFWGWNPFWYNTWWGWPAPAYGYYGYPSNYIYGYPDSGYSAPEDNSTPPAQQDNQYNPDNQNNQNNPDGNWVTPNGPSPLQEQNSGGLVVPVLIYMKDGTVYTVRDYWMLDGELHYISISGVQKSVNLDLVDFPRTNTENAKSGVRFIFKSAPSVTAPPPDGNAAPPAQPHSNEPNAQPGGASEPSPSPTQQLNAVPQPEART